MKDARVAREHTFFSRHTTTSTRSPHAAVVLGAFVCNSTAFDEGKALIVESGCELDGENLGALVHFNCPVQLDTAAVTESVTGATVRGALTVRALLHPKLTRTLPSRAALVCCLRSHRRCK